MVMSKSTETKKASKSSKNPYTRGNYCDMFNFIRKTQGRNGGVTRKAIESFAAGMVTSYGKNKGNHLSAGAVNATIAVILSPRQEDGRGDCRGNYSAKGHVYYVTKMAITKAQPDTRYRLEYRKEVLPQRTRAEIHPGIEQEVTKVETSTKKSKKTKLSAETA
jgi:hypothetical protein